MDNKKIIGLTDKVKLIGNGDINEKIVTARIDTGATMSSVDAKLAAQLQLGPIVRTKKVKSSLGEEVRPVVKASVEIAGKRVKGNFSVADRKHMKYSLLIGQNILKMGFLVDPQKK